MVSRAENVVNQHMDLFGVIDDALLVYLGPTKGDQDGSKHTDHPWHIYSVPDKPEICPCIAFAEYLMSNPMVLDGECKVFDGASQYERYNNIMRDIVRSDEYCDAFKKLGLSPDHFGTHSIRKGAITHAACGTTVSITWRTCHERFSGRRGLFRQLGIGRGS
jgi:hypothetical protein